MLVIPGASWKSTCDGITRRDLLRVGSSAILGVTLADILGLQMLQAKQVDKKEIKDGPGFGKAKSVILLYLQGGPSHLDLWDPKDNVPANVKSIFKPIPTKVSGTQFTELLPKLAQVNDRFTMIRSMSYTPVGLFNHTAAIYQIMTGYTADKVSPSGQLEPPSPKDFPNFGSNVVKFKPPTVPMLPFVMLPRPLQESNVVGKGGTAGFLGKAFDPYTLFPEGDDMDFTKMDRIKVDDLKLRPEVFALRLQRRANPRNAPNAGPRDRSGPMLDQGLSGLLIDMDERGLLKETLVVAVGEFGRSPQKGVSTSGNGNSPDGRDHWPYCYTAVLAGAGIRRGHVHGKSDKTGSAPLSDPVHPGELLATIYHAFGIDPATIVLNHLNQPRELVKAEAVTRLFA